MAVVPVRLRTKGGLKEVVTYAFLDPGSSISICCVKLAEKLGASKRPSNINVGTVNSPNGELIKTCKVAGLEVRPLEMVDEGSVKLPAVYTLQSIPVTEEDMDKEGELQSWPHLNSLRPFARLKTEVGLMIGANVPDAFTPTAIWTGPSGSPYAAITTLGWVVWNVVREKSKNKVVHRTWLTENEELKNLESRLVETFNFGFTERTIDDEKQWSQEDRAFMEKVGSQIKLVDGHYEISLPFRESIKLPCNRPAAESRLTNLRKRLMADSRLRAEYVACMNDVISKGYAELVPEADLHKTSEVWYIPHHGVYHPKKAKLRVVFDCAAKYNGVSLNDALLQGPDLTNNLNLVAVLLRFREKPVAVSADIESMFHQVRVAKNHTDYLRSLWWEGDNLDNKPQCYRMVVHLFGGTSSPCCANLALRTAVQRWGEIKNADEVSAITRSFYVDDHLRSYYTVDEAVDLFRATVKTCSDGGFISTKFLAVAARL
ncbi:uncharacterized protein LOC141907794 [Tubulanus polymorphus]|uniref:uncharacterized protein LOC141907794 n=1 Tax=Tubulanus polymorphus TaxID=672921 RepID=UPI003DA3E090